MGGKAIMDEPFECPHCGGRLETVHDRVKFHNLAVGPLELLECTNCHRRIVPPESRRAYEAAVDAYKNATVLTVSSGAVWESLIFAVTTAISETLEMGPVSVITVGPSRVSVQGLLPVTTNCAVASG
jgi:uncharacterized Zn finger protein